jgi:hypothetical protein
MDHHSARVDNLEAHIAELLGQLRTLERIYVWLDPVRDNVTRGYLHGCSMDLRREARQLKLVLEKITGDAIDPNANLAGRQLRPPALVYFS